MADGAWENEGIGAVVIAAVATTISQTFLWLRTKVRTRKEKEEREAEESTELELARLQSGNVTHERFVSYLMAQLAQARVDISQLAMERDGLQVRNMALARRYAIQEVNVDILKNAITSSSLKLPQLMVVPPIDGRDIIENKIS